MISRTIILICVVSIFISCNSNKIFEKHQKFKDNKWSKSEIVSFDVLIEDIESFYDISVAVRHASAYPYANVNVGVTILTPVEEKRFMQHSLIIRNEDGSFIGDGLGDIFDVEVGIYEKMAFKHRGLYKFSIENRMHLVDMPGIMSIGLVVRKSKTE